MARRNGRKGDYLMTSDYSGSTEYASKLVVDYWGSYGRRDEVLERNLQEIAQPLNDPYPVSIYRGPMYEATNACIGEQVPLFIGNTNIPTPTNTETIAVLGLNPGIGQMQISCTFRVS